MLLAPCNESILVGCMAGAEVGSVQEEDGVNDTGRRARLGRTGYPWTQVMDRFQIAGRPV